MGLLGLITRQLNMAESCKSCRISTIESRVISLLPNHHLLSSHLYMPRKLYPSTIHSKKECRRQNYQASWEKIVMGYHLVFSNQSKKQVIMNFVLKILLLDLCLSFPLVCQYCFPFFFFQIMDKRLMTNYIKSINLPMVIKSIIF